MSQPVTGTIEPRQYFPRRFPQPYPMDFERDDVEALVALADSEDWERAYRDRSLRVVTLALGSSGAWLVWQKRPAEGYGHFEIVDARPFPGLYELLQRGLSDAMRTALGLDAARLARLARLDVLRTLIAQADLPAARASGRECLAGLAEAFAVDPARAPGDGALGRPATREPAVLARLAGRALAWFFIEPAEALGRVRQLLSLVASALDATAFDPWETSARARDPFDEFFDPAISLARLLDLQRQLRREFGPPEPNTLGYHNGELAERGVVSQALFGPERWLRCRCGRLTGPERRGERCGECGVSCVDVPHRETRFGVLHAPCGLVHPATAAAIAEVMQISVEEVRAVAQGELCWVDGAPIPTEEDGFDYGPVVIRQTLAAIAPDRVAELLVRAVPVVPVGDRPEIRLFGHEGSLAATRIDHPITAAYAALLGRICEYDRMVDLGAPALLIRQKAKDAQIQFDRVFAAITTPVDIRASEGATDGTIDGWGVREPARSVRDVHLSWHGSSDLSAAHEDHHPPTCLWLSESRIAVHLAGTTTIHDLERNAIVRRVAVGDPRLQACDESGRHILVTSNSCVFDSDDVIEGFGCFDTETGAWLDVLPGHIPAVTFGKWEPEDGVLFELRRGLSIAAGDGDRPMALCFSHGNHFVLESGDYEGLYRACIRATQTGLVVLESTALDREYEDCPVLCLDGTLVEARDEEATQRVVDDVAEAMGALWQGRHHVAHPAAMVDHPDDGWRLLRPGLLLCTPQRSLFVLGFAIECACFRPDGERLLALTPDELIIVDIGPKRIVWRAPIGILESRNR